MDAILKRRIERSLKANGFSHKQACTAVSVVAAILEDWRMQAAEMEPKSLLRRLFGLHG